MRKISTTIITLSMLTTSSLFAVDDTEVAKKLANPIAAMISVPFQFNYDSDIGKDDTGSKFFVNVQPVVPISLNDDWYACSIHLQCSGWILGSGFGCG